MDGPAGQSERAEPAVRGLLRDHAHARRAGGGVPAPPADGPAQPPEHDRLGRRPHGRARTTAPTRVYHFPADTTVFGPAQIEARIDQDPVISPQFTLWNQSGSTVIRGNLIVVPVGDSLIYLQPVYLQSTGSAFPEFQRIIVASPREVVWARDARRGARAAARGRGRAAAEPVAVADARPRRPRPTPSPPTPTRGAGRPAVRRARPHRLRERPLRARPGGPPGRRLRAVRRGDRQGRGGASPARRARPWSCLPATRAVSLGATLSGSLLAVLDRPSTWPLALAGFLVRGGWLLVLGPDRRAADRGRAGQRRRATRRGHRIRADASDEVITVWSGADRRPVWLIGRRPFRGRRRGRSRVPTVASMGDSARPTARTLSHPPGGSLPCGSPPWSRSSSRWRGAGSGSLGRLPELTVPSDVAVPVAYRVLAGRPTRSSRAAHVAVRRRSSGPGRPACRDRWGGRAARGPPRSLRDLRRTVVPLPCSPWYPPWSSSSPSALPGCVGHDMGRPASRPGSGDISLGPVALLVLFVGLFTAGLVMLALATAWRSAIWTLVRRLGGPTRLGRSGEAPTPGRVTRTSRRLSP